MMTSMMCSNPSQNIIIMTTSNEELNNLFNFKRQLEGVSNGERVGDLWKR
jgi:hypothetical protein